MHPNDELLRALVDRELPEGQTRLVDEHLKRCPNCRTRLLEMRERAGRVHATLHTLGPLAGEPAPSPRKAYGKLFQREGTRKDLSRTNQKENYQTMFTKRPFWVALTIIAVLAVALSITPVRAWASDVLSLFRVQRVTVIEFNPEAANFNRDIFEAKRERMEALMKEVEIAGGGEVQEVASVEEAAALAGYTPRLPAAWADAKLAVKPATKGSFVIDRNELQALFDGTGTNVTLPEDVDGKTVLVDASAAVFATRGCPSADVEGEVPADCLMLAQMPSPVVDVPAGIDPQEMGKALLQFLGYSAVDAARLSERIDWATTLVLPLPQTGDMQYRDASVDGVTGTLVESDDEGAALLWVKDGVIYGLRGTNADAVLAAAADIQ